MSLPTSDEIARLVWSVSTDRTLGDRLRGTDHRVTALARIAEFGTFRVVPDLLPALVHDIGLAPHVARAINNLTEKITPSELSWLDEQVRRGSNWYLWPEAWHRLTPQDLDRVLQGVDGHVKILGLLSSHANGYVRAAAIEKLATSNSGREIPFLALRANDWVKPIATRAHALLVDRLRSDNRDDILSTLPFIIRALRGRRHEHADIVNALGSVLLVDQSDDVLSELIGFDLAVRRPVFALLFRASKSIPKRLVRAALRDKDAQIRAQAINSIGADTAFENREAILLEALSADPAPLVRRMALNTVMLEMPDRLAALFPGILMDHAASVRDLARFISANQQLPFVPRDIYLQALVGGSPKRVAAALEGVGETGDGADADVVAPFLSNDHARIRRAALRALGKLDAERGVSSAIDRLGDTSSSVRRTAIAVLSANASRVDFSVLRGRARELPDPRSRTDVLKLLIEAPKWDAVAFLLEAVADQDEAVSAAAVELIKRWLEAFNRTQTAATAAQVDRIIMLLNTVQSRLPEQLEKMLRFSTKPLSR